MFKKRKPRVETTSIHDFFNEELNKLKEQNEKMLSELSEKRKNLEKN